MKKKSGHAVSDSHILCAGTESRKRRGQTSAVAQSTPAPSLSEIHAKITYFGRFYLDVQEMRKATANRIRRMRELGVGESYFGPLLAALDQCEVVERDVEKELVRWMMDHPLRRWIEAERGIGLPAVARLLALTGPITPVETDESGRVLAGFPNVAKLWAYCGYAVDTDGHAPRRRRGKRLGFNPMARVLCYRIGDAIVKTSNTRILKDGTELQAGKYRAIYDTKKAEYQAREPRGESQCRFGQWHKNDSGKTIACGAAHVDNAARRYAIKAFLRDLWVEWMSVVEVDQVKVA